MGTLDDIIKESVRLYPDGQLPEAQRLKILRSVPIYAASKIGREGAQIAKIVDVIRAIREKQKLSMTSHFRPNFYLSGWQSCAYERKRGR